MRLNKRFKGLFIFGLILLLGVLLPCNHVVTAYADETQEIKLNVNSQTIVKGKSFSLYVYNLNENQNVTFVSSDSAIASVDEYGIVTGNLVGTATILVTVTEEENTIALLSCDIKVGPPAISVQFSRLELTMTIGQKLTLERIVLPLNTVETAKFSSHDRSVATVSAGGRVTAKAEGSTYIFAQLDNGRFAVCKVYVCPEEIVLEPEEVVEEIPVSEEVNSEETNVKSEETSPEEITSEDVLPEEKPSEDVPAEEISEEEQPAEPESSDPFLEHTDEMDFETFIKNLNAAGKSAESAESTTGDAN